MRYQYEMRDGSRGAVGAASAPEAARRVAERLCGKGAAVESFVYEGRSWQNLDCCGPRSGGAGRIKGKAWRAVVKSVATAEQLLWGGSHGHTRYEHRQYELHITEGRVDAEDKRWKTTRYPRRPIMGGGELGGDDTRHPARSDVVCGGNADLPHGNEADLARLAAEAAATWAEMEERKTAKRLCHRVTAAV